MPTSETLKSLADLISAVAWPLIALRVIKIFHPEIVRILNGITKFKGFGIEAEIEAKIEAEVKNAGDIAKQGTGKSGLPTTDELNRAIKVERLSSETNVSFLHRQVEELAAEYERVRASMSSGPSRTRRMEVVMSKMRTIGRAAYSLRYELKASPSPGKRLQAIASLQVIPDFEESLDWLAERLDVERPFIAYHAVVALNSAASNENAPIHIAALERALAKVRALSTNLSPDSDRQQMLGEFESKVTRLREHQGAGGA